MKNAWKLIIPGSEKNYPLWVSSTLRLKENWIDPFGNLLPPLTEFTDTNMGKVYFLPDAEFSKISLLVVV